MPHKWMDYRFLEAERSHGENGTNCGCCVERCQFAARNLIYGMMRFEDSKGYDWGSCITECPTVNVRLKKLVNVK